ncbi:hypothetical protein EC919_101115 [Pseudomonas graminis]|uniref:hypothetical protein n=1 Tax=Pseudomonas graminis TaxID=158627 RepID=UPI00105CA7C3|nr:hypothetical protein [Pseudomonas graminis]TDV58069.1 hypothetical protein EC919_101115 [Pseudomonas graminis]
MRRIDTDVLYQQLDFLEGDERFLEKVKPVFQELIKNLSGLPVPSAGVSVLPLLKSCILKINDLEEEIETVERDSLLDVIYRLGELVGLPRESEFAEEWRGDW